MASDVVTPQRNGSAGGGGSGGTAATPGTGMPTASAESGILTVGWAGPVKRRATCPHCWCRFHIGDILWVARHEGLRGDPVAGPDEMRRFLPSRFDARGNAVDARGVSCTDMACPQCRLPIARALLEASQVFVSLVGVPGSGKSYLTAAMSWRLRELLPRHFGYSFLDVDPIGNAVLIDNEQTLFLRDDPSEAVSLEKTQMQGSHYETVRFGEQSVSLARPFQFLLSPQGGAGGDELRKPRVLNLYDNAGEHFLPGNDTTLTPGTQHVARANALMFLFDPLQDPRCRARLAGKTEDPQIEEALGGGVRQDTVLNEMGQRIRRYAQLDATATLEQPLLVLVGKADAWLPLAGLSFGDAPEPIVAGADGVEAVDTALVERVSDAVRRWLLEVTPEFVSLAEATHRVVRYLPVSALGGPPQRRDTDGMLTVKPDQLQPRWVAAPLLYALSRWGRGTLPEATGSQAQPTETQALPGAGEAS